MKRLVLKPDAFVVTADASEERLSFVEVDLSTESLRVIRKKALVYIDHWRSGGEQRQQDAYPQVLFVVRDEKRRAGIVDTLSQLDPESWQLFRVVIKGNALEALTQTVA